jgi:hypothetical protein
MGFEYTVHDTGGLGSDARQNRDWELEAAARRGGWVSWHWTAIPTGTVTSDPVLLPEGATLTGMIVIAGSAGLSDATFTLKQGSTTVVSGVLQAGQTVLELSTGWVSQSPTSGYTVETTGTTGGPVGVHVHVGFR